MAIPNPARLIQSKAETLSRVSGADNLAASFQNAAIGIENGVREASQSLRVLGSGNIAGDLSVGADRLQAGLNQAAGGLQKAAGLGAALSDPAGFLKGRIGESISSLTGVLDSATDQLEQAAALFAAGVNINVPFLNASSGSSVGSTSRAEQKPAGIGKDEFLPNQLRKYASYNCIFKFGAISANSVNFPDQTYRINGADVTILQSGGGGIDSKRVQTVYDALGQQNGTAGNLEYFIDEFQIDAMFAPSRRTGMAQAMPMSFKIHEPYSMGLFLQSLQAAALEAGFQNYLKAPFMLELDFIGWDDEGNSTLVENANRKIALKLMTVEFDVERSGSVYTVNAIPWNEQALMDESMRIPDPIQIVGTTLLEALSLGEQSLVTTINRSLQQIAQTKGESTTDFYVVRFPTQRTSANGLQTDFSAANSATTEDLEQIRSRLGVEAEEGLEGIVSESLTGFFQGLSLGTANNALFENLKSTAVSDVNVIGASSLDFPDTRQDSPFGLDRFTYDSENNVYKRNGVEITLANNGVPTFTFDKGVSIQSIIEELVTISNFGITALRQADSEGMIRWYKLEPQCFVVPDPATELINGKPARIFVYNVVPYEVHSSVFSGANSTHSTENRKKQIVKQYDYIYSGKNEDVLAFDLKFNAAFFTAIQGDFGELVAGEQTQNVENIVSANGAPALRVVQNGSGGNVETTVERVGTSGTYTTGGGSYNMTRGALLAQQFQRALLDSDIDLVTAEMEIWGDPYYIPESGLGNYNAPNSGQTSSLTIDGSVDWQRSEVDILINFKTPIDYGDDGYMTFPNGELGVRAVGQFSGVYKVLKATTTIRDNRLVQRLSLIRRRNQEEYADQLPALRPDLIEESQTGGSLNSPNEVERPGVTGTPQTPSNRPSTGVARPDGVGDTSDLTNVTAKGPPGEDGEPIILTAQVAKVMAPNFQALIDELQDEYGYVIESMGGYRDPAVAGINQGDGTYSRTVFSWHNSGLAIDINPAYNPFKKPRPADAPDPYTDMPAGGTGSLMSALAAKHGLGWGGDWTGSIDAMHFSAGPNEGGSFDWVRDGTIPRGTASQLDTTDDARAARTNAEPEAPPANGNGNSGTAVDSTDDARAARTNAAQENPDTNDPRGRDQIPTSGTTQVTSTPTATNSSAPVNSQVSSSDLRPYLPLTPSDNRYDYLTGDKIRSILASNGGGGR